MAEEKNITVVTEEKTEATAPKTENQYLLKLNHPYVFEGKEYAEIDLAGLDKLTVQDAINAQRQLFNEREQAGMVLSETTTAFSRAIAAKATGLPIEFFKIMPRGAFRKVHGYPFASTMCIGNMRSGTEVHGVVFNYMNVDADTENHIMRLAKPYYFEGKEYTEVDLNGVGDLNSLNESEAENRMVRAGFMITETTYNYLHSCILASMATGLPEAFFTGLPMYEVLKIKNAVNDEDFFE